MSSRGSDGELWDEEPLAESWDEEPWDEEAADGRWDDEPLTVTGRELERVQRRSSAAEEGPVEILTGLVRLAAGAWFRTALWGVGASVRLARAAADPQAAAQLAREVGDGARSYAREILGVSDLDERLRSVVPTPDPRQQTGDGVGTSVEALRSYGEELLRRSADMDLEEDSHPAYARILEQLSPDEARILRLMAKEGDQPAVDVRKVQLPGLGSQLLAEGLNMIGQEAGARHPERVASYLNNLYRLGLVWFSKEPIDDPVRYQVLEAQPAVLSALKSSGRTKAVQRSVQLTPFGRDFCQACLPL